MSLFIAKALLGKLPFYISYLLVLYTNSYRTRSGSHIRLNVPRVSSELVNVSFLFMLRGFGMICKNIVNPRSSISERF